MVTLTFYFIILMGTISSIIEKKISRNLWLLFLANEINTTKGDKTDPTVHVQNDIFNNPKTTDIQFLISRKFEVTILLRKSEGIKGLPNR